MTSILSAEARKQVTEALREISAMYAHTWDHAGDGALLMMPSSVPRFEAAHAGVQEVIAMLASLPEAPAVEVPLVALTDQNIIDTCASVGIKWIAPYEDPGDDSGNFPGSFDMVTMAEMRSLFQTADALAVQFIRACEGPRSTPQVQGEVSDARDAEELRFYRRWGFPFTDHSTVLDKGHEGLCAIMLPLSLPHPDGEGTCTLTTIRAFTNEQLYEKAKAHIAEISAKGQP